MQAPLSQVRVSSTRSEHMVDVASLGDAELRIAVAGLAASRPQAEITAHIATSLEALLAAQRQDIGQRGKPPNAVDLDQRCVSGYSVSVNCLISRS